MTDKTTHTEPLKITFGRRNYPDDVAAVWGARLIWPNDLLWDRQDLAFYNEDAKQLLISWLNGPNRGDGAISKMQKALNNAHQLFPAGQADEKEAVLYEDDQGKIIGSPQGSFGYVYVAGWLK